MEFRIADTFTDSLTRLTGDEQKMVKMTAFDLQLNPVNSGMSLHKLDRARDKNFWSVRVSGDLRLIVHRTDNSFLLCYVDHHDRAYEWAERRKLETHPKTGAAQWVEIRQTVQEVLLPVYIETPTSAPALPSTLPPPPPPTKLSQQKEQKPLLFQHLSDDTLLSYGVPTEWLADVRQSNEDTLLLLADHLPGEAAEALLEVATGGKPRTSQPLPSTSDPFAHPDAQRRFRLMRNVDELERALTFPWDKWTIFLHPEQRQWVERSYNGPARVSGSAGTGKTIVALHRAVFLARSNPTARILLTTFSDPLANALRNKLVRLVNNQPRLAEQIDVDSINTVGNRLYKILYKTQVGSFQLANDETIHKLLIEAANATTPHKFTPSFLHSEWDEIVDAWQLASWEAYRDVPRLGRKTRLPEAQRRLLWSIFAHVREALTTRKLLTPATVFTQLASQIAQRNHPPYDFAVVDEAQDLTVAHIRFFAALASHRPDALFFAGDLGQRIFQQPFSWKTAGVDVRGRARTLRVNYRTSHQIRMQADCLLDTSLSDVDGNSEERGDTVSVFNGPPPEVRILPDQAAEIKYVSAWVLQRLQDGVLPHEFGIFVRSTTQLPRAQAVVESLSIPFKRLNEQVATSSDHLAIGTMHLAKGLEFRAVVLMACDNEVIPLQARVEAIGDQADLEEVYATERHLLYVACTRARDFLLVTSTAPASEFLDDLRGG